MNIIRMIKNIIIITSFLYVFYHIMKYLNIVNQRECVTVFKVDPWNKKDIETEKRIYNRGIFDEFYNIIVLGYYLKNITKCIDNDASTECDIQNIPFDDWQNIKNYLEDDNRREGDFTDGLMEAYRYRLYKCSTDPNVNCDPSEIQLINDYIDN